MKRVLLLTLLLAITTLASARDKKTKAQPGPYIFTSKASALTHQGGDRPGKPATRLFARFRRTATVSLLEARSNADDRCGLHGLQRLYRDDHQKSLVVHAGRTQRHHPSHGPAGLGISRRLLQNPNAGSDLEPARGDGGLSSHAGPGFHLDRFTLSEKKIPPRVLKKSQNSLTSPNPFRPARRFVG